MRSLGAVARWSPWRRLGVAGLVLAALIDPAAADPDEAPPVASPGTGAEVAAGSESDSNRSERPEGSENAEPALVYRPPSRGRPRARVGGGVRGVSAGAAPPQLVALAPDHVGATTAGRPALFWFVSGLPPASSRFVFTLVDPARIEPVLEIPLDQPASGGIQRVDLDRLARADFALESGVEYEWAVSLVIDPRERALDVVGMGWIDRVPRPAALASQAGPVELAGQGLWYDALTALEDGLVERPGDARLEAERSALLSQGGLAGRVGPFAVASGGNRASE